jgi:hypothetical protein
MKTKKEIMELLEDLRQNLKHCEIDMQYYSRLLRGMHCDSDVMLEQSLVGISNGINGIDGLLNNAFVWEHYGEQ